MDVVYDEVAEILYLLFFKPLLSDVPLADLFAQYLASNIVFPLQHKFHLIQNKVNLFLSLK